MKIIGQILNRGKEISTALLLNKVKAGTSQKRTLKKLLTKAKNTAFGRHYNFSAILESKDIYKAFLNKEASPKQMLFVSRLSVLIVALIALLLAISPKDTILNLVGNAWAGFGAAFGPLILLALLNKKSTWQGALFGMITGGVVVLLWVYIDHPFKEVYEIIPGFIVALIVNLMVSKLTYRKGTKIEEEFPF